MTESEMREWIDNATYEQLLSRWRFAPSGDTMVDGDLGLYYKEVMLRKRFELGPAGATAARKAVGWNG